MYVFVFERTHSACVCVRACVRVCVRACVRACVCSPHYQFSSHKFAATCVVEDLPYPFVVEPASHHNYHKHYSQLAYCNWPYNI